MKNPRKGVIESSVFLLISHHAALAWRKPAERLQSEYARCKRTWERGGWKDGRSVNVSLYLMLLSPPKALSKVSEQREPRPEMFKPLVTTWSKAALHFLIFALKWEPLHRSCVCEHSGAFYLTWFPRACLKVFCCLRRGRDMVRKGAIFLGW